MRTLNIEAMGKRIIDEYKRARLISEISHNSLEPVINDYMVKKGILNYRLFIDGHNRNVLEVQIVDQYWMFNDTVNLENIDRILRIIPYLIARPDRIPEDGLGFRRFIKYSRQR